MLYAVICDDQPGGLEIRKANRAAHLEYLKSTGVVAQAGPPLSVDQSGAEVDVPDADLAGLVGPFFVRGDALREVGVGTRVSKRRGGTRDDEEGRHDEGEHRHAEAGDLHH